MTSTLRAVLFDFGGVILSSPLAAFHAYEKRTGLPHGFLQRLNTIDPDTNAWACAERGEIDENELYRRFEAEALREGHDIDARAALGSLTGEIQTRMVDVVRRVKGRYRTACLTNNMFLGIGTAMSATQAQATAIAEVMSLFDHVVESRRIGTRKPEPAFFTHALDVIGASASQCVFLDDLGMNLKPAKALGMTTIKVVTVGQAISDLATVLGHAVE